MLLKIMRSIVILLMFVIVITSCTKSEEMSYNEMKTMVLDILKTEDAQKAIAESKQENLKKLSDEEKTLQMLKSPQGEQMQEAVKNVLTDPERSHIILKTLMTDPKFAGEFAKTIQEEDKEIHKQLMTDPEYQTMLIDVMKGSDFEALVVDIMKGKAYRQQTMNVLEDTMKNPLFRLELLELMKKAVEEQHNEQKKEEEKQKNDNEKNSKSKEDE